MKNKKNTATEVKVEAAKTAEETFRESQDKFKKFRAGTKTRLARWEAKLRAEAESLGIFY
jgi:hypothetical protein